MPFDKVTLFCLIGQGKKTFLKKGIHKGATSCYNATIITKEAHNMPHVISDECIKCGACEAQCPVSAISEGDDKYIISDDCIDCGACAAQCPVSAISEG